jgi:hypothetical protein
MFANTSDLPTNIIIKYSQNQTLGFHLIDVYNNQPIDFKNMAFIQYLTNFKYDKLHCPTLKCDSQDDLGNFIHNKQPNEMQLVLKPS